MTVSEKGQPLAQRNSLSPRRGRRRSVVIRLDSQHGFSLLEVLVSIIILSFGLLGAVGLQATALKNTRDAKLQSVAVNLGREMAEMMRANAQVAGLQAANPYVGDFSGATLAPTTTSTCLNIGSSCASPTEVANAQMTEWLARVSAALPQARVSICYDTAPYDANGLPQWACTSGTGSQNILFIKIGWTREGFNQELVESNAGVPYMVLPVTPGGQL